MGLGPLELIIILFLIFLLLGPKRIAGLLKSSGRALYDFTDSLGRTRQDKELPEKKKDTEKK